MRIAITGGTGFVGGHLATELVAGGHQVVVLARGVDRRPRARQVLALPGIRHERLGLDDADALAGAFDGCQAVAHCAGVNRQLGRSTYQAVHVDGTANVVRAAERAGVQRLTLLSFLRARPACGSPYHESKWAAEEIVRRTRDLHWTVLKPGMIFGRGDHMLDHLSHALHTFPVFVGLGRMRVRPLAVQDLVRVLLAALVDGRLARMTVPVLGPTELDVQAAVQVVADATGRHPPILPLPLGPHYTAAAWVLERLMTVPMLSMAQVRILREEVVEPVLAPDPLPADLIPATPYELATVRAGLPEPGRFGRQDLRWCRPKGQPVA
jgi:nucleoside-diphosphate-sugar epimerase